MPIDPEKRRRSIGGSEVAAILGCDESRSAFELWMEKRGLIEPRKTSWRMQIGKSLQQGIIELYEIQTGRKTRWSDMTCQHPEWPWMIYTPDALCQEERRGIDAKWVGWDQRNRWGPTAYDIPPRVRLQALWYLMATDFPYWDIAALIGDELRVYTIERDRELEQGVFKKVYDWQRRYLVGSEQPPLDLAASEGDAWLNRQFARHGPQIRSATLAEITTLDEYAELRAEFKEISKERERLEKLLKAAVAEDAGIRWDRGTFTWKRTRDRSLVDWEGLAQKLLVGFSEEEKQGFVEEFTEMKPGYRRIWFRSDLSSLEEEED